MLPSSSSDVATPRIGRAVTLGSDQGSLHDRLRGLVVAGLEGAGGGGAVHGPRDRAAHRRRQGPGPPRAQTWTAPAWGARGTGFSACRSPSDGERPDARGAADPPVIEDRHGTQRPPRKRGIAPAHRRDSTAPAGVVRVSRLRRPVRSGPRAATAPRPRPHRRSPRCPGRRRRMVFSQAERPDQYQYGGPEASSGDGWLAAWNFSPSDGPGPDPDRHAPWTARLPAIATASSTVPRRDPEDQPTCPPGRQ